MNYRLTYITDAKLVYQTQKLNTHFGGAVNDTSLYTQSTLTYTCHLSKT